MIRMIQRRLIIPRGDTGSFSIPYLKAINPGDVAVFTIFDIRTKTKMYQKLIAAEGDILNIAFTHGDTVNLKPGKYLWDIKFYTNPQIIDDELVNGDEVDSYYAGFSLPECEIRETGDTLLTSDDAPTSTISPESLNIINAAINEILNTKRITVEAAETASLKADAAAESAEDASNSASAASQSAALAEARVNEIENLSVEVNTGLEGTDASVTYTPSTGVLSFIIPRGNTGNGIASCVLNDDFTLTINYTNGDSTTTIPIRGDTPHLTIGEVTEGPHAIATITGTDANPILNLTLPNANVPTRVSQLENDAGYLTEHQDLSNYVQKTDYATANSAGVVKVDADKGIRIINNTLEIAAPQNSVIQSGQGINKPVVVHQQHRAVFYGLAKAAGDTTQSQSSNAVGTYTDEAKAAIQQMLDVPSNEDIPTQVSELTNDAGYLTTEIDPTVPAWAKAAQKPSYTAAEVGAPTVQEMNSAISTAIGNINSFDMAVVQALPTQDISTHTIYLVPKTGETNDVYDEYVYINDAWEMVGNTQIDLSNYVTFDDYATHNGTKAGIIGVLPDGAGGLAISPIGGRLYISGASDLAIKSGAESYHPIVSEKQHQAVFYGLAKAAGDSTQSASSNAVGTYTDEAKAAIQTMLDVPSANDLPYIKGTGNYSAVLAGEYYGYTNKATGIYAVAQGIGTSAEGNWTHTEGMMTVAKGQSSHAEGQKTLAAGSFTHAEGAYTLAIGESAHIEGSGLGYIGARITGTANATTYQVTGRNMENEFVGGYAVIGNVYKKIQSVDIENNTMTVASSFGNALNNEECSISIGYASGRNCHNEGIGTISNANGVHTEGQYNVSYELFSNWVANTSYNVGDYVLRSGYGYECIEANSDSNWTASKWQYREITSKNIFTIGNGKSNLKRSNALTVDINGNGHFNGNIYIECNNDSTGGTKVLCEADFATDTEIQNIINGGAGA